MLTVLEGSSVDASVSAACERVNKKLVLPSNQCNYRDDRFSGNWLRETFYQVTGFLVIEGFFLKGGAEQ